MPLVFNKEQPLSPFQHPVQEGPGVPGREVPLQDPGVSGAGEEEAFNAPLASSPPRQHSLLPSPLEILEHILGIETLPLGPFSLLGSWHSELGHLLQ